MDHRAALTTQGSPLSRDYTPPSSPPTCLPGAEKGRTFQRRRSVALRACLRLHEGNATVWTRASPRSTASVSQGPSTLGANTASRPPQHTPVSPASQARRRRRDEGTRTTVARTDPREGGRRLTGLRALDSTKDTRLLRRVNAAESRRAASEGAPSGPLPHPHYPPLFPVV